ncbi:MAG TPA: ferredoxin [Sunxiuqinia sp.]|nr:ferredoxin [Sunxiuqinia sp.]
MAIKKVWIEEGCIADGICSDLCPAVFDLNDDGEAFVKDDAVFDGNEIDIKEAAESCPVEIIKFEED